MSPLPAVVDRPRHTTPVRWTCLGLLGAAGLVWLGGLALGGTALYLPPTVALALGSALLYASSLEWGRKKDRVTLAVELPVAVLTLLAVVAGVLWSLTYGWVEASAKKPDEDVVAVIRRPLLPLMETVDRVDLQRSATWGGSTFSLCSQSLADQVYPTWNGDELVVSYAGGAPVLTVDTSQDPPRVEDPHGSFEEC